MPKSEQREQRYTAFCSYQVSTSVSGRSLTVQPKASARAKCNLDGAVGIVALSDVEDARDTVDLAEVKVVKAEFTRRRGVRRACPSVCA